MKIVLLSRDLLFISRVKEVALAKGTQAIIAKSQEALVSAVESGGNCDGGLLLIDLEKSPLSIGELGRCLAVIPKPAWRLVAFYSHLNLEVAEQARELDIGEVVPRSKFVQLLPTLF